MSIKPLRAKPEDTEVVVRSEVRGRGEPSSSTTAWKRRPMAGRLRPERARCLLVETYKTQFAKEINTKGIDGLIASLVQRNKAGATAKAG